MLCDGNKGVRNSWRLLNLPAKHVRRILVYSDHLLGLGATDCCTASVPIEACLQDMRLVSLVIERHYHRSAVGWSIENGLYLCTFL